MAEHPITADDLETVDELAVDELTVDEDTIDHFPSDEAIDRLAGPTVDRFDRERTRASLRERLFGIAPAPVRLGRFAVLERLGQGAMGSVYAAYDPELDRKVAVKLIRTDDPGDAHRRDMLRARLQREAQAMARLSHPNVVAVYDVGTIQDELFIAMEYVAGTTLRAWLADQDRTWREVIEVFQQAGRGLAASHGAGLIHRDFKPDNVLISTDDRVRVTDFGVARAGVQPDGPSGCDGAASSALHGASLTRTGGLIGTPRYMAPEQLDAGEVDPRTDQFGFCVSLYEALYGVPPFGGDTFAELRKTIERGELAAPTRGSDVPARVRAAVVRGLQSDRDARYPSMDALLADLAFERPRRARWPLVAAALVACVGAAGVFMARSAAPEPCRGAQDALEAVWSGDQRAAVRAAFVAAGVPGAEDLADRALSRLDRYGADWTAMHTQACRATRIDGSQSGAALDLRMTCLGDRLDHVRALVELFEGADAGVVENAIEATYALPGLERCADVAALTAAVAPPDDASAAAVEDTRRVLREVRALDTAARYERARELAEGALTRAVELDYPPLVAEARLALGRVLAETDDLKGAEQHLSEAFFGAVGHGHDPIALAGATRLTGVVGDSAARPGDGRAWARHAQALITRTGEGDVDAARLATALGSVASMAGAYDEAIEHHGRAAERFERALGDQHPEFADALAALGIALRNLSRYDEAQDAFERARAIREAAFGSRHPQVGKLIYSLAMLAEIRGDLDTGLARYRDAHKILRDALGPDHSRVGITHGAIGNIYRVQGKLDEAMAEHRRALAIHKQSLGEDHPYVGNALNNIGVLHFMRGELDEAARYFEQALKINEKKFGPDHPLNASYANNIGSIHRRQGRYRESLAWYERAIAIDTAAHGPDDVSLASALRGLGESKIKLGRRADGLRDLRRAEALLLASPVDQTRDLAEIRALLAEVTRR